MKIIERKSPFEDWELEVSCTGKGWNQCDKVPCGSKLGIDVNDLVKREWFKYPDDSGAAYGFVCPVCDCYTEIENGILTEHLKNMAKDFDEYDVVKL